MFFRLGSFSYFRHSSWKFSISHTTAQLNISAHRDCPRVFGFDVLLPQRTLLKGHLWNWKEAAPTTCKHLSSSSSAERGKRRVRSIFPSRPTCRNSLAAQVLPSINFPASEHLLHFEVFHRSNGPAHPWAASLVGFQKGGVEKLPTGRVSK